jgi:hypothetical protein
MKKLLLLIPLLFLSCETPEPIKSCECEKQFYDKYNDHLYLFTEVVDKKYCDGTETFYERNNQIYKYVLVCE